MRAARALKAVAAMPKPYAYPSYTPLTVFAAEHWTWHGTCTIINRDGSDLPYEVRKWPDEVIATCKTYDDAMGVVKSRWRGLKS